MASPEDPSDSSGGSAAAKELTADDFERLSSIFRPSWKLDDAPFTAGATLSQEQVQALQGKEPHRQAGVATAILNGAHPVAVAARAAAALDEAPFKAATRIGLQPPAALDALPTAPPRPASTPPSPAGVPAAAQAAAPPPPAPPWNPANVVAAPLPGSRTIISSAPPPPGPANADPAGGVPPAQRPTVPSFTAEATPSQRALAQDDDEDRSPFSPPAMIPSGPWGERSRSTAARTEILRRPGKSRRPMWLGIGAAVAALAVAAWLLAAAGPHPSPTPVAPQETVETKAPDIPPPREAPAPPVSAVVAAPPAPPEPPAAAPNAPVQAIPPPEAPPVPSPPAAAPVRAASPTPPAPKPAPVPRPAPEPVVAAPAPRPPVAKPKAPQTIVHDVPF